ncbi:MAG: hypothetical protein HYX74_11375 [Acidobacteria bacterium]|nr:hypothetical protein [Acidobacteriota bacterium]
MPRKATVLVAVQPPSLLRVIEYLFWAAPDLRVVGLRTALSGLVDRVARARPELVVVNAKLLGPNARNVIAAVRRASPGSKLIVTCFLECALFRTYGVEACIPEESLVRRLVPTVRRLSGARRARP